MWPTPQETMDLAIFTKEALNGRHHLCSVSWKGRKRITIPFPILKQNQIQITWKWKWTWFLLIREWISKLLWNNKQVFIYHFNVYNFCINSTCSQGRQHRGSRGGAFPPQTLLFCITKRKKQDKGKKKTGFKAETIKSLSPRSKYYCFSHSRASRIRKFFL